MRFALAQSLGVLLRIQAPSWFSRLTKKTILLDAEARDDGLFAAAPEGYEVVVASATPLQPGSTPYGPAFDPAHPPFPPRSFHAVLAGPCLLPRAGAERERAFRGLLGLARGVLVLALPATGSLGELGAEAAIELAHRRLGADHPWSRILAAECGRDGPTPGELEELAGLERASLLYLPASDPVGGAALAMFRAFVLGLPEGPRLAGLVDRFFNTALIEAGPTLGSRYQDLALVFPGRRGVPGAVAARAVEDRTAAAKAGRTDVASLQLALELDSLDRRGDRAARSEAEATPAGPGGAELARWREVLEEMGRKVERMAKEAEVATGRALEGTGRMQVRLEAALETVASVQAESRTADGLRDELEAERERRGKAAREADESRSGLLATRRELELVARDLIREREEAQAIRAAADRAEKALAEGVAARSRSEAERAAALARAEVETARTARAEAEAAGARERLDALEAEIASAAARGGESGERLAELEAALGTARAEAEAAGERASRAEAALAGRDAELAELAGHADRLRRELAARTGELAEVRAAQDAAAGRQVEGAALVERVAAEREQAAAQRAALEGRLMALQAAYDGLAGEIDEFRRVVSSNPLLKAYIVAKGARLPGSPAAATAAPARAG